MRTNRQESMVLVTLTQRMIPTSNDSKDSLEYLGSFYHPLVKTEASMWANPTVAGKLSKLFLLLLPQNRVFERRPDCWDPLDPEHVQIPAG